MTEPNKIQAEFPEKLGFLFQPHRYKVLFGGRGGMKSWGIARALLIKAVASRTRVLCTREVQNSIKDSVHKLLSDQIQLMGFGKYFRPLETVIRGINGSEFTFSGLATHTVESIKSYEGCDIAWCEEAHVISERSWKILIPTILRKPGSEIWLSFNPDLETDPTYQRFIVHPPDDCMAVKTSWRDNPWHSDESESVRLYDKKYKPDDYPNIWEGKCRPAVEGAIYFKEIQQAQSQNRICDLPYDPMLKVHIVFDLGQGDSLFILMVQKHLSQLRVIDSISGTHFDFNTISTALRERKYNWGKVWLPHDGFTSTLNSGGKSSFDILTKFGWDVAKLDEIVQLSVEEGIRNARLMFHQIYFDKEKTADLIESLKRYKRRIVRDKNGNTQTATTPMHDDASHGADCFRYMCVNSDSMTNDETSKTPLPGQVASYHPYDAVVGY